MHSTLLSSHDAQAEEEEEEEEEADVVLWTHGPELSGPLTHLGQFPLLVLGHVAIFASELTAPKAQRASTGV